MIQKQRRKLLHQHSLQASKLAFLPTVVEERQERVSSPFSEKRGHMPSPFSEKRCHVPDPLSYQGPRFSQDDVEKPKTHEKRRLFRSNTAPFNSAREGPSSPPVKSKTSDACAMKDSFNKAKVIRCWSLRNEDLPRTKFEFSDDEKMKAAIEEAAKTVIAERKKAEELLSLSPGSRIRKQKGLIPPPIPTATSPISPLAVSPNKVLPLHPAALQLPF